MMAELLALVDIGYMDLYNRAAQRTDAVLQGDAGVGIGTCIEYDAVARWLLGEACLLHFVDQLALDVALVIADFHIGISVTQLCQVLFERR